MNHQDLDLPIKKKEAPRWNFEDDVFRILIFDLVTFEVQHVDIKRCIAEDPCMVYLATFNIKNESNAGKYTSPMDPMGIAVTSKEFLGSGPIHQLGIELRVPIPLE